MFILSLLLIATGAVVRNVVTIHSTAIDVRLVGTILLATGICMLVLQVAAVVLGGDRPADTAAGGNWTERPDAPRPPMPQTRPAPYRSISGNRFSSTTPRSAPYRSMSDPSNPYGWNSIDKRRVQVQQQIQRSHRSNAERQQQQVQRFHRSNTERQQQMQRSHRKHH